MKINLRKILELCADYTPDRVDLRWLSLKHPGVEVTPGTVEALVTEIKRLRDALKDACWCGSLEPGRSCDGCDALKQFDERFEG